jgi:dolichol kinase
VSKTATPLVLPFGEGADTVSLVRPSNVARSAFHVGAAIVSLLLIRFLPSRGWLVATAGSFALWAWSMEIGRRFSPALNGKLVRFFSPIAHAHERHQTNSSTWYVTALTLLAAFAPMTAAELGVLVLGLADPAAGEIGRRWGRTRIRSGRSLEGTLGFVFVGTVAAFVWLLAAGRNPVAALWVASIAGVSGALAELASTRRFDDNFAIPLVTAASVTIALSQLTL